MRSIAWGVLVTGIAGLAFALVGRGLPDTQLRALGGASGALVALSGAALGLLGGDGRRRTVPEIPARFFHERRRSPRHAVTIPVHVRVNGAPFAARLLSVSSSGALLRLDARPGAPQAADIGQTVVIEDYPAGTLARVSAHGLFIDFAVAFDAQPAPAHPVQR